MSNDSKTKKRKLPELPRLNMRPAEVDATRSVVRGIMRGSSPEPPAETPPVISAPPAEVTPVEIAPRTPIVSEQPPPETHPLPKRPPLPPNAPHLRTPYETIDRLRLLKPGPRAVCEEIFRAAAGWHSDECIISVAKLAVYCRIEEKLVRKYVAQLQSLGYIERLGEVLGGRELEARGVKFRILLPRLAPPAKMTPGGKAGGAETPPNKENALNKDSKSAVCDLCKETGGYLYPNGIGKGGVKKCDHRAG